MGTDELAMKIAAVGNEYEHRSLAEYAHHVLRTNILQGHLQPNTRLREVALAEALGVSRVPIREALRRLAAEHFVELRGHGRGAVVATPDPRRILEYYQARAALERLSVRLAAERITEEQLTRLRTVADRGRTAVSVGDFSLSSKLGAEFHLAIAQASGNEHLVDLIETYDVRMGWAAINVARELGAVRWEDHDEILFALERHDVEACAHSMERHTDDSTRCFAAMVPVEIHP